MIDIACLITSRGNPEKLLMTCVAAATSPRHSDRVAFYVWLDDDDTGSLWAADTREPDPAYLQAKHDAEAHMRTYGVEWREAS